MRRSNLNAHERLGKLTAGKDKRVLLGILALHVTCMELTIGSWFVPTRLDPLASLRVLGRLLPRSRALS